MKKVSKEKVINLLKNPKVYTVFFISMIIILSSEMLLLKGVSKGADLSYHITRIEGIAECIKTGDIKAATHPNSYGYGNGIFYPQVFLYIPALLVVAGIPVINAYKVFLFICNIATAIIMYFSLKSITKSRRIGIIGAAFYTTCNFRLIYIYWMQAIGSVQAFAFIPLVILGIYEIVYRDAKKWYILSAGILGLLCCHLISSLLVICFLCLPAFILGIKQFIKDKNRIKYLLYSVCMVILLFAFFELPFLEQILNYKFVLTENTVDTDISNSVLPFYKNIIGIFRWDRYRMSGVGWLGVGMVILTSSILYFLNKKKVRENYYKYVRQLFVISIIYLIAISIKPIWKYLSIFNCFQFVWRIQMINSAIYCMMAAMYMGKKLEHKKESLNLLIYLVIFFTILFSCMLMRHTFGGKEWRTDKIPDKYKLGSGLEYIPYGTKANDNLPNSNSSKIKFNIKRVRAGYNIQYENNEGKDTYIELPLLYYKGYSIIKSSNSKNNIPDSNTGYVKVYVYGNSGNVYIEYSGTIWMKVGYLITIDTCIGIAIYVCIKKKYYRNITRI